VSVLQESGNKETSLLLLIRYITGSNILLDPTCRRNDSQDDDGGGGGGGGGGDDDDDDDNVFLNLIGKVICIQSDSLKHSIEIEKLYTAVGFSHIFM
jgi:hypothetical protein